MELRNRITGLEYVESTELHEHPKNWRRHTSEQRDALQTIMEQVGIAGAVLAYRSKRYDGKLTIVDGHLRKGIIQDKVPVLVLDVDDEEADILLTTYDSIGRLAMTDEDALKELVASLKPFDGMDQVLRAIQQEEDDVPEKEEFVETEDVEPEYPIEPVFDESYDYVVIFCRSKTEWHSVISRLKLEKTQQKGLIAESRVVPAQQFCDQWDTREERPK